jgi:hypothetical protein
LRKRGTLDVPGEGSGAWDVRDRRERPPRSSAANGLFFLRRSRGASAATPRRPKDCDAGTDPAESFEIGRFATNPSRILDPSELTPSTRRRK